MIYAFLLHCRNGNLIEQFSTTTKTTTTVMLTSYRLRKRLYFEAENRMKIFMFTITRNGHTASKEGDMPEECETNSESRICTKYLNRRKWTDDTNPKRYHVGE